MTPEAVSAHSFTPSQLENQRVFRVGPGASMPEQPGDAADRRLKKLGILVGATAVDLAESWGAEKLLVQIREQLTEHVRSNAKRNQNKAIFSGIAFVEDVASDEVYVLGMNALLRGMTGLEEVSYPSPTAKLISGWTNLGSYASGKFGGEDRPFWKKPWNVVNAVNTEAAIGLLEELPLGIGKAVEAVHAKIDEKLSKSEAVQFATGIASAAVTGYHIEKNMVQASHKASAAQ